MFLQKTLLIFRVLENVRRKGRKQLVYAFPGFYNKETISSNNLKIKLTPQEVVDWFGCGHGNI